MTRSRKVLEWAINGLTAAALAAALGLVMGERVIPAVRASRFVDPGERIPRDLLLRDLSTGDTVALVDLAPATFLAFLSTCPACESAAPAWRSALEQPGRGRLIAMAVGDEPDGLEWAARELPEGIAVLQPLSTPKLLSALRIRLVPTALAVGPAGTLLDRVEGVIGQDRARRLLALPSGGATPPRP